MAPISLKIVLNGGAVTRKVKFDTTTKVDEAHDIVKDKMHLTNDGKEYGLFLRSADDDLSGVWLENHRTLDYYMLRDGDSLDYLCRMRNLRVKTLDGTVKTLQVDEAKPVGALMFTICSRIGISNHDEYGLCQDVDEELEESKDAKQYSTGTLTLGRKAPTKEKDVVLEQLIKKHKTDDDVQWLDQYRTLREIGVDPKGTLLLKRRLYYSDRNVDSRDPVQLNLLYVQIRDLILMGRQLVTEEQAVTFAGIQCQIHFGDFQEEKHKPGFIENPKEYLPEQYSSSWSVEKKILKEYRKHQGLAQVDAKYLYTKTARDLPTYGVTFFLVKEKEKKGKKKLVPRLLGINAESILRLDEVTKEILQVWPLTHVKTYHVGKGETFTLNFGDYSDKEYCVKTRDAFAIRDILQGYIDLIRKRMLRDHRADAPDGMLIEHDTVCPDRGNVIEHITHGAEKIVEHSFVGPTKLIPYEQGAEPMRGTQLVTVQQIVVADQANKQQRAMKGEVPMRSDMSMDFVRKLNRLNSNSVKIVTLLTDPDDARTKDAQNIVSTIEQDTPIIAKGVYETIEKQNSEAEKKKLLDELQSLLDAVKNLSNNTRPGYVNPAEAQDAAKKIADLSTQMYFSMDPKTKRRSQLLRMSRKSFILEDQTDARLRRPSFIAAATTALHALDTALGALRGNHREYTGPPVDDNMLEQLEKDQVDKIGKLNAAVALYLTAHADPQNIDYAAGVNSMNTINKIMPELVKDAQAIGSTMDDEARKVFFDDLRSLCEATKKVCTLTGIDDHEKMQEASNDYADLSGKLIFTLGHGANGDKENEVIGLAKQVGDKTSVLLVKANELTAAAPRDLEQEALDVDTAGVRTAIAARDLLACAQLTAPAIHEPHCQSALTAAAETLSSSAQHLAASWKPLVEDPSRHALGEQLHVHTMDLAKALDRLKDSYGNLSGDDQASPKEKKRVRFDMSLCDAKDSLTAAEKELEKPYTATSVKGVQDKDVEKRLSDRMAQLNAAIAALLAATADRENPDYETAELAVETIKNLMPEVVKDTKAVSASKDEATRAAMLQQVRALCEASRGICASVGQPQAAELGEAVSKFADASGKLVYVVNPRAKAAKEQEIMALSAGVCGEASKLLAGVQQLASSVGGEGGAELDARGAHTSDAAQALLTTAQVTASSIESPRCQSALLSAADNLSQSVQHLRSAWQPLQLPAALQPHRSQLEQDLQRLDAQLDKLRAACHSDDADGRGGNKEQERLKFIDSMSKTKDNLQSAEQELNKPAQLAPVKGVKTVDLETKLSDRMAQLNAAIAALLAATADKKNPDYAKAEQAAKTISELMPGVVKDTKAVSASKDEATRAAMLQQVRALCEASRGICASVGQPQAAELGEAVSKFADASGKLVYVVNPRAKAAKEQEIMGLSAKVCGKTSQLLAGVQQLAGGVGGEGGAALDARGAHTADAAQALLATAQVTAPTIESPRCQSALVSAADDLSQSAQQLRAAWQPLQLPAALQPHRTQLEQDLHALDKDIDNLRAACSSDDGFQEKDRLKLVSTLSKAKDNLQVAEKELKKPITPVRENVTNSEELEHKLSDKMAQLNAAIAALIAATSDKEKPNYAQAERAVKSISELMPDVVKDTKAVSASKDEATRAAMLQQVRALCEASRGICASVGQPQAAELGEAVSKFADASGKLVYVVNPRAKDAKEQEIMALSAGACGEASKLLAGVQQLASSVGGEGGAELDARGAHTADAAQALLTTAQVTAPSIESPRCQSALVSAADNLSQSAQQLRSAWQPLQLPAALQPHRTQLEQDLQRLNAQLDKLRAACHSDDADGRGGNKEQERLKFINSMSKTKDNLQSAEQELNKPVQLASKLLAGVQQLASSVGGEGGAELDARGAHTADAAQALLTTAQVTAPSIESPRCQSALVSAADNLSQSAQQLRSAWQPLQLPAALQPHRTQLEQDLQRLDAQLDKLRAACHSDDTDGRGGNKEQERLKFINSMSKTKDNLQSAEQELNKPVQLAPVKGVKAEDLETKLSDRMAQLNAAIATLLAATADKKNPDYAKAEQAAKTISELMPGVVKDTKAVSASKDEATRAAMLQQVRALCEASRGICASVGQPQAAELGEAVSKFADASGKLVCVVNPRAKDAKEQEIMGLSAKVCGKTSQLLAGVQQLAGGVGGEGGAALDARGAHTADAAQALLATAQVTAPTIESPRCQSALVSAADDLSQSAQQLRAAWQPLQLPAALQPHRTQLEQDLHALDKDIDNLRAACSSGNDGRNKEKERVKLTSILSNAKDNLRAAEQELNKPLATAPVKGTKSEELQNKLADKMAQLNAAIALLISATSDRENPNYVQAEQAVKTITDLMPEVVKDTKAVSASKDEVTRAAMLQQVRALCEASRGICASVGQPQAAELGEAVSKYTEASGKLNDVVSLRANGDKEQRIMNLSASVCGKASQLLAGVQHLAGEVADQAGRRLDASGTDVADAAQALLTVAQVTAPTIESPRCQSALVSAADDLSQSAQQLRAAWQPLQLPAALQPHRTQLEQDLHALDKEIEKLRAECLSHDRKAPSTPTKPQPPVPARKASVEPMSPRTVGHAQAGRRSSTFAQEFLDQMRMDESKSAANDTCKRKTDVEKILHQEFLQSIDDADKGIRHAEEVLRQIYNSQSTTIKSPAISPEEITAKQRELEDILAAAGVEVANLVSANYADNIDYKTASKCTKVLPQLMNSIAEDAKILQHNQINEAARKAFMNDMLGLCQASRKLCDSAKNNREKLNDAAVEFGDKSAKLLHEVSIDVDPFVEKEIISRAKAIGDSASRLALESAELASSKAAGEAGDGCARAICEAGASCVDAAGKLVYTSKLVAPSIHNSKCQEALISSADNLSMKLKTFSSSRSPLAADPRSLELAAGAERLEALLGRLRRDLGNLGALRRERVLVAGEDTPLRQSTMEILEDVKRRAERTDIPAEQRRQFAQYSNKLSAAVMAFDLANSRCIRAPNDTNKRRELECAIQNLQTIVLQERPKRGDKDPGKIVDLLDFVQDVSNEAEKLTEVASSVDLPRGKGTVADIKDQCHKIIHNASSLLQPAHSPSKADNTMLDDILEVDQFGQDCDNRVEQINSLLNNLEGEKAAPVLKEQTIALTESCNLLRFAAQSALASTRSAALDEALEDLLDLETNLIKVLVPDCAARNCDPIKSPLAPPWTEAGAPPPWARGRVAGAAAAAARGRPGRLSPALTAYIADAAARTDLGEPAHRDRLLHHLHKLVDLIKSLTVCTSKRVATWQHVDGPEVSAIIEQILRELENPESIFGGDTNKPQIQSLLSAEDVSRVLSPSDSFKFDGDQNQLSHKLQQLSTQLSSMCSTVLASAVSARPASLARGLHAAADVSAHLAAVARAHTHHAPDKPIQSQRIEEAAQEMSYSTYNLMKTAEFVSQDPSNPDSRRKLLDACRGLTESINKLVRVTSPGNKVQRECGELTRSLQLQQSLLQGTPQPTCALPYADCVLALQSQHDVIQKLKSEEAMPRTQFLQSLHYVTSAVRNTTEYATQCAYFIAISDSDKDTAKEGLVDVPLIQKAIGSVQDSCMKIIRSGHPEQTKDEKPKLQKRVQVLVRALEEAQAKAKDEDVKLKLTKSKDSVNKSANALYRALDQNSTKEKVSPLGMDMLDLCCRARALAELPALRPAAPAPGTEDKCEHLITNSKTLLTKTQALIKEVAKTTPENDDEMMTWVMYNNNRNGVLDVFDSLLKSIKTNGHRAGILEIDPSELEEGQKKSFIETQVEIANKWLKRASCKAEIKAAGEEATKKVIEIANKMCDDLKGSEKEEMSLLIRETEQLLAECTNKYDNEKYSTLMDRLKELRKVVERGVVTRVVEDLMEGEEPLADLDLLADAERDEAKRKFLLERKIAELLAQLGRVTTTARFVANTGHAGDKLNQDLHKCSEQTELLAPMLVQAAQQRINSPNDKAVVDNYKALLAKYAESLSKVRELCDQAVDPMDFVQTAGETMQRMRDESAQHNDPQKCAYTSTAITKLANRVIQVSLSSRSARGDPELQRALSEAQRKLSAATPGPDVRASRLPDWRDTTAEILRTTGEVESVLGGENIFNKQADADQPIYNAALSLHAAVRGWSSRDNDIVGAARKCAVHMARLADYMHSDRKHELLVSSKSIVTESHEVALLAKRLAHECTDLRIKTNLLQSCERIPTISGQLKMLTTVKGSSLGHQGSEEDKEAMNMLVGNAENLMLSIQEVVKAAASASVRLRHNEGHE